MTKLSNYPNKTPQLLLVTGVSGAGKSSALKALEDIEFEAIDNVPIYLLERLVTPGEFPAHLAIGADIRTRDFDPEKTLFKIDSLTSDHGIAVSVLFLDCQDEVLLRRFAETRRKHPLAIDRPVIDGLKHERKILQKIKERATLVIDTSEMSLADLKLVVNSHFGVTGTNNLSISITSFGFRNGLPSVADLVFDVRFLKNPYYDQTLRELNGTDQAVGDYIKKDPVYQQFFDKLTNMMSFLIDCYVSEGKNYLTVAFGCTGGKHRSVFLAESLAQWFKDRNFLATTRHRDVDKPPK